MKLIITRTSMRSDNKPCPEAFKTMVENWETRTCTEEYFNKNYATREGEWRSKGTEHKVVNNGKYISRRLSDREEWAIKIESLNDILKLQEKYGDIILRDTYYCDKIKTIEIYDDYRE